MTTKTFGEQIADLETTRAAKAARLSDVMQKSMDEGRTTDEAEGEEADSITAEIKAIDTDLVRLKAAEKLNMEKAAPVAQAVPGKPGTPSQDAADSRAGTFNVIRSTKNEEKGVGFAKLAMVMFAAKGSIHVAQAIAEQKFGDDVRLQSVMKAAVAAGTTTDPTWAGSLVDYQNLSSEFVELLKPATLLGQFGADGVPSLRRVPFNVRIPGKTVSGTANWVGEGYMKPVSAAGYAPQEFKWAKIAGIRVITDELERFSDPSVQVLVRDDLKDAIVERADTDFVDPAKAAGTGAYASPASITNGIAGKPATANAAADINSLWVDADAANMSAAGAVYITTPAIARVLANMENAVGAKVYPNVGATGGNVGGIRVLTSNFVPAGLFILAFASEIYLADDGVATIDVSREATIIMDDDPNGIATVTAAMMVNMFQTNQLAIRAERYLNWARRRPTAVSYLTGVAWTA